MIVEVKEPTFTWVGHWMWEEGTAGCKWAVVRPLDSGTHVRRGSGTRECDEDLIRVPLFLGPDRVTICG